MHSPRFAIVIPTRKRPKQLAACLNAIGALTYPRDRFQVVIVDDHSDEPLDDVVAPWRDRLNVRLLHRDESVGPAAARNAGISGLDTEYVAFTDDDCTVDSDWLTALAEQFRHHPHHLVGGQTRNALSDNACSTASQILVEVAYAFYNTDPEDAAFFASNNMAMPLALLHCVGGFDAAWRTAEDRDLCDRWRRAGHGMSYAPGAVLHHAHALTLRALWRQHVAYGRGAYRYHRALSQRGAGPFRPALGFYRRLFAHPWSHCHGLRKLTIFTLLVYSQVANTVGFALEKIGW